MKTQTKPNKKEAQAIATLEAKTKTNVVNIFGDEVESRKYELKEVVQMIRTRFEKEGLEVGKMAYYGLALRHLKLVDISYETLAQILIKIFELNGQQTNTTAKCMAWYQGKIKKGIVNIHEPFKASTRTKVTVDISSLF